MASTASPANIQKAPPPTSCPATADAITLLAAWMNTQHGGIVPAPDSEHTTNTERS